MANGDASGAKEPTQAGVQTGKERRADTWPTLFEGLKKDIVA